MTLATQTIQKSTFRQAANGRPKATQLTPKIKSTPSIIPPAPATIEATGVPADFLRNLVLRILHQRGLMTGGQIAVALCLPFAGVVDPVLDDLKRNHLVEVKGGNQVSSATYRYVTTDKGSDQATKSAQINGYTGPCPVTLEAYTRVIRSQADLRPEVGHAEVQHALKDLILPPEAIEWVGSAVLSFKSLFLYGPPGNGKTSIAKAIGRHLLGKLAPVPHAIYAEGQVIKVYDSETHQPLNKDDVEQGDASKLDRRWVPCRPPLFVVGGELTLDDLNLTFNDRDNYHEAPPQLKANGGMFLIDDFGRQQMAPKELLNRWIVPLEEQIDYLRFHNGTKVEVPFETLIIFSTNLEPSDLVDAAFLRRIRHKLGIENPDEKQFYRIFYQACQERGIDFDRQSFIYLLQNYYQAANRPYQACHARDLLDQLTDFARFRKAPVRMTVELIDKAAGSYFALSANH